MVNATNGSRILFTNGFPAFVPGQTYFLGVQNTNALSVTYALAVNFGLTVTSSNQLPITTRFPTAPRWLFIPISTAPMAICSPGLLRKQ